MGRKKTVKNMLPPVTKVAKLSKENGKIFPEELIDFLVNNYDIPHFKESAKNILVAFNNRSEKDRLHALDKLIIDGTLHYVDGRGDVYTHDCIHVGMLLSDKPLYEMIVNIDYDDMYFINCGLTNAEKKDVCNEQVKLAKNFLTGNDCTVLMFEFINRV